MQSAESFAASKILLFGGFQIEKEASGPIWLTGKRGPAILAYLARCQGMAAPRERLADLLWSDSDSGHSRNSLRQTLSVLRRDLSRQNLDILYSHRDLIGLRPDAVRVDVEEFETGLSARSAAELQTALALYHGPFLDGFYVGTNVFDDWAALERERLLSRALASLEKLARLVDPESGLAVADRMLAMEPTREEAYRLKMELLVAGGQRDKALRTFEACRSVLRKEFGVDVSVETRALWQSLLSSTELPSNPQTANGAIAGQRSGRPSIAVADFVNLTGQRGDDFFAKGLVHDITTALSEVADYIVISAIEKNGEEPRAPDSLRARYTLKGTVQRSGDGLRVNIQLVDAADGHNVWAQKFDGQSESALEFQD
ncbi:transcriptional regulator, partial [Mesorhizobium sp. CU2]